MKHWIIIYESATYHSPPTRLRKQIMIDHENYVKKINKFNS